jgi:hypothetical protein
MNSVYKARTREQVLEGNLARKRSRFNGKVMSYTPTAATGINSKASATVREHRNATICPLNLIWILRLNAPN